MTNRPPVRSSRSYIAVAAAIVIAAVIISATISATSTFNTTVTKESTTTTTLTSVLTNFETLTASIAKGTHPITLYRVNGEWNFSVSLSSIEPTRGQNITATFSLTNISNQTQSVVVASPLTNPAIYTQAGQWVWEWEQSATNALQHISEGQTLSNVVTIPTSELHAGQTYVLTSSPNVLTDTNPEVFLQNLQVNATIIIA